MEGVATHIGSESCAAIRKGGGEALTGERAGQLSSRERTKNPGADAVERSGRPHRTPRQREGRPDLARSQTLRMHGRILHGNREIPPSSESRRGSDRIGKSKDARVARPLRVRGACSTAGSSVTRCWAGGGPRSVQLSGTAVVPNTPPAQM